MYKIEIYNWKSTKCNPMGIMQLLKFIHQKCPECSNTIHLSELSGKSIVIDISIYMYKYKINGHLFDNMYLLSTLLLEHSITPVFVFDGPKHFYKQRTLEKRSKIKSDAIKQLNHISKSTKGIDKKTLTSIKNKSTRITEKDVEQIKELLTTLGIQYIDAPYEADEICAKLMIDKKVYACLSDDTDMFAYGCSKILTNIDLFHETTKMYNMSQILRTLRISQTTFRELCILSGTDYNESFGTMYSHYNRYQEYKKTKTKKGYYEWLHDNKYIKGIIYLSKLYLKFDLNSSNYAELKVFEKMVLSKNQIFKTKLNLLLRKNHFINP